MKGIITSIKRFSAHDGEGLRTAVFFKGCAMRCIWCHNPETLRSSPQIEFHERKCISCATCANVCKSGALSTDADRILYDRSLCIGCGNCSDACPTEARVLVGEVFEASELADKLAEEKPFFDNGGGVTFSGGECLLQADFAAEVAKRLKDMNISVNIDTCGFVSRQAFDKLLPYADAFLYDIKAIKEDVHIKCTSHSNKLILENLEYILSKGADVEIRYPLVPSYNDNEVEAIGKYLQGKNIKKIKVLAYHDLARSKYRALGMEDTMPRVTPPDFDTVENAVLKLRSFGINAINGMSED